MRFLILSPRTTKPLFRALFSYALLTSPSLAQITGGGDFGLGGSSVMWLPRASALYLNPAEFSRLHQAEFFLSTNKFSNLSSFSAVHFEPFLGTFAAGIANFGPATQFSAGYGRVVFQHHTAGAAFNIAPDASEKFSFSLGVGAHFPDSASVHSGFHAGLSLVNIAPNARTSSFGLNLGAAYWVRPDLVRAQASFLQQDKPSFLIGAEVRPVPWASLQIGTQSFKHIVGGLSVHLSYTSIELAGGKEGFVMSFNFRMSDPAADYRTRNYDLGVKAYEQERYYEARQFLLTALQYDEYFSPARTLATQAAAALQSNSAKNLEDGKNLEQRGDDAEALKRYAEVVKMDPTNVEAQTRLANVKSRIQQSVKQLIATGDSLMEKKNYERAQKAYEQALQADPENEAIGPRLEDLAILLRQSTQLSLTRAKSFLDRNLLDEAQKEYERVLTTEPRNAQARSGLETIRTRRLSDLLEKGKSAFTEKKYFDALAIFTEVLARDDKNRDAKTYLDRTREALQPEVEKYFKQGLQLYVKENYKAALETWDKALVIQPQHQATLEYYKRAQEKQKAIEKLEKEN